MQIGRIISITGKQNGKKNNENKLVFRGINGLEVESMAHFSSL